MFEFEETKKSINYMKVYVKDEKIILDDLIKEFNNMSHFYNTNNSSKLDDLILELKISLEQLDKNLVNNISIIEKNVLSYKESKEEANDNVLDILEEANIKSIDWGFKYG